jgi:hypothetical protein
VAFEFVGFVDEAKQENREKQFSTLAELAPWGNFGATKQTRLERKLL